jgi:hypothetical protein
MSLIEVTTVMKSSKTNEGMFAKHRKAACTIPAFV